MPVYQQRAQMGHPPLALYTLTTETDIDTYIKEAFHD